MLSPGLQKSMNKPALGVIDKIFATGSPAQAMIVCDHHVWMSLTSGAEVRNARTSEHVHGWNAVEQSERQNSIWSLLAVQTRDKNAHVWMGLSSGVIEVYDAKSFHMVRQLNKHAGGVYCLAEFGGFVYSGSSDFQIAQWYAENGRFVRILRGHKSYVRCLYAEGSAIVSGSDDCTVRVWDAGSGEAQLKGYFHGRAGVSALCRVGVTMWSGDNEGRVIAWKLSTCEALRVLQAHGGRVMSLRKIGSRVYSGGADGVIAVFNAEDGQLVQRVEDRHGGAVTALVGIAELRRFCIWSCGTDNIIRCWHQDEYVRMTGDQERFTENFWYQAGSTPYREFCESMKRENSNLCEKILAAQQQNARMLDLVGFSSSSLSPEHTQKQELKLKKEYARAKELQVVVQSELQRSKEELLQIEKETGTLLELLRVAQGELRALDPTALSQIMAFGGAYNGNAGGQIGGNGGSFTSTRLPDPPLHSSALQPSGTSWTEPPPPPTALSATSGPALTSMGLAPPAGIGQPQTGMPSVGLPPQPPPTALSTTSGPALTSMGLTPPAGTGQPQTGMSSVGLPPQPPPTALSATSGPALTSMGLMPPAGTGQPQTGMSSVGLPPQPPPTALSATSGPALTSMGLTPPAGTGQPQTGMSSVGLPPQPPPTALSATSGPALTSMGLAPPAGIGQPQTGMPSVGLPPQPPPTALSATSGPALTSMGLTPPAGTGQPQTGMSSVGLPPQPPPTALSATSGPALTSMGLTPPAGTGQPQTGMSSVGLPPQPPPTALSATSGPALTSMGLTPPAGTGQPQTGMPSVGLPPQPPPTALSATSGPALTSMGLTPPAGTGQPQTGMPSASHTIPFSQTLGSGSPLSTAGITKSQPGVQISRGSTTLVIPGEMPSYATNPAPGPFTDASVHLLNTSSAPSAVVQSGTYPLATLVQSPAVVGKYHWKGVEWTNKNVGCYIQRRYYGAEPSLRTPALEKRRLSQGRLPDVKVEPRTTKSKK